jgi:hypothetical protein
MLWLWPQRLHPSIAQLTLGFSLGVLVLGVLLVPVVVARLPADYLTREPPALGLAGLRTAPLRFALRVLRNLLGALLLLAGIAMLVLPGQGILTMLAGLSLMSVPGKRRLERRLLRLPGVRAVVTAIRRRAHQPPLQLEPGGADD